MVSAAHRRKVYNDIPEEKKNLMLAARRKIYRLNKQESMLGNTSLLGTAQDGSVLGRERASLCAAVPPNVEAPVPSTVLRTVIPFMESAKKITELRNSDKPWVKTVTVHEKFLPYQSTTTSTKLQKFVLMDDTGAKVEGIMFNKAFRTMASRLQLYHKYRISNAEIKEIDKKYVRGPITMQWIIDTTTVIEPVEEQVQSDGIQHNYVPFSKIHEYYDRGEGPIDVMGIVVDSLSSHTVATEKGPRTLQKFVLMNESFDMITITLWGDFVNAEGAALIRMANQYPVLTALRVNIGYFNGLELSTNFRTSLIIDAPNDHAATLKHWANNNRSKISELLAAGIDASQIVNIPLNANTSFTPLGSIVPDLKVVSSKVSISITGISQSYFYMACKKCLHATTAGFQFEYTCNMCMEKQFAAPRTRFEVKLTDHSGAITASLFGKIAEDILGLTSMQAMEGVSQEYIQQRDIELSKQKYIVQIKMVKPKHHEVTPKYTVATCVEEGCPQFLKLMTSKSNLVGSSSVTSSDVACDESPNMISITSTPEGTNLVAGTVGSENVLMKNVAPETPLQVPADLRVSSRGKAKTSLVGRFEDTLEVPKPEPKKRRQ